jgi:hypothetical protein
MRTLLAACGILLAAGCAHTRITHRNGCWVRETESRFGDTRQEITVCAPQPPTPSADPVVRAVEACLYQAQLGFYGDAIERLRTSREISAHFDWNGATARCLRSAEEAGLGRVAGLQARIESLVSRTDELAGENRELRRALVKCAEKTPNAVATAHSTSGSDAGSDAAVPAPAAPPPPPPAASARRKARPKKVPDCPVIAEPTLPKPAATDR